MPLLVACWLVVFFGPARVFYYAFDGPVLAFRGHCGEASPLIVEMGS
jgi:hypothetical protein